MADYYTGSYAEGFAAGYQAALDREYISEQQSSMRKPSLRERQVFTTGRPKTKRKQSGKQKILTKMAKKAWDKYKKGSGKKSYIDIRAQVSRSQAYKKATKGM